MKLSGITNQIKRMTGGIVDLYRAGLSLHPDCMMQDVQPYVAP
jgi:hypothetical protein